MYIMYSQQHSYNLYVGVCIGIAMSFEYLFELSIWVYNVPSITEF